MTKTTTAYQVGRLYEVDPGELKIGTNVRTDTRPDAKAFAASIKTRGVLEVITAHVDGDGALVVVRGQRRTLVAAKVGTPTATVPVRVVPSPQEADRIIDQVSENVHRENMRESETRDAVEQLAMLGVSAAQIARRTALPRPDVDNALAVVVNEATKVRMDAEGMTLQQAAIFAEFEDDPDAIAALTVAWENSWRRDQIGHYAQRLRDERAERQALAAEADRLRARGLRVLAPEQVPANLHRHRLANLRTEGGEPVPEEQWPSIPGAAVVVTTEWVEPQDEDEQDDDHDEDEGEDVDVADPEQVYVPVWVCTDPEAAGLHYGFGPRAHTNEATGSEQDPAVAEAEVRREAESAERRRVITNNKAWRSAEVVRREWLAGFVSRRTIPAGAEALIARAVIGCEYTLSHALQHGHTLLPDLLGVTPTENASPGYYGNRATLARIIEQATTPKAATMRTLAAVLASWEERSGTHTWRNPSAWDAAVIGALTGWGYPASDVEQLLVAAADSGADGTGTEG